MITMDIRYKREAVIRTINKKVKREIESIDLLGIIIEDKDEEVEEALLIRKKKVG